VDPSGHSWECPSDTNCDPLSIPEDQNTDPTIFEEPEDCYNLTRCDYGPPFGVGTEGEQAWAGLIRLSSYTGAWWGNELDSEEAIAILLFYEFGEMAYWDIGKEAWTLPPEIIETATRKYNQFCSGGTWTADCLQGFWGYSQVIREATKQYMFDKIRNTNLKGLYDGAFMGLARSVMTNPQLGGQRSDRPSEWATLRKSVNPETLGLYWNNITTYGVGNGANQWVFYCYPCTNMGTGTPPPNALTVVFTRGQYPGTITGLP